MKSDKVPEKMAYRLEEVSRIAKLDPEVIDAWEEELYFIQAGLTGSGDKIFRKRDLDIILRLKDLLEKGGMTLAGAKRRIEEEFGIKSSTPVHPDRLKKVLVRVRDQLHEIASSLDKKSEKA
ncbi:MAG: MerR family transcriptional regulator [Candidatus Aminicenantes bacterium]|jgi:DNA-binding transcriptional MerR regulator|nr:MerR family transcriptional regulator [Candidatus Aminicenantes bacterium]MDH5706970.1 MerR family transcriptional regulator [Candidatus Aminicenantes bacterium]